MADSKSDTSGPKTSYEILKAEGDDLYRRGEVVKAIYSYNQALELLPDEPDKHCLVCRARCYLKLGNGEKALEDAEASLEIDKEFPKGLHLKAEALYGMGDFETALVFFHRGQRLRPEMEEFRLGVQKAKEAIENSVGDPDTIKLENKGDLSHFTRMEEEEERKKRGKRVGKSTYSKPIRAREDNTKRRRDRKTKPQNDKTVKQLLGELYADKEYLEKLLNDQELCHQDTQTSYQVHELVLGCLEYLDTRTEFWQQQKPLYARERERQMRGKISKAGDINKWIVKQLESIDEDQNHGKYTTSLKKAQRLEKTMAGYKDREILNRASIMANIASLMGNAYLEMGEYDKAEDFHNRDRQIAVDNNLDDAHSRALDNLGRVYARRGEFEKAIDMWEEKLPLAKTALEKTWLYHEIGRCHQELKEYEVARNYGEKSLAAAQEAEDDVWQLNACVLIAQAEVKLGDLDGAQESFERAYDMAKAQGDAPAEAAIKRAIDDVKKKMVQGMKEGENKDLWKVTVVTSDKAGAGTDAKVFIVLYGNKKESRKLELASTEDSFEKGSTNTFDISTPRIGIVQRIKIGHDNSGKFPGWHCEKVILEHKKKGHVYTYEVDQWFDSTSGDEQTERECFAEGPLPEEPLIEEGREKWHITVHTSNKPNAGTDANIFLVIMGSKGNTQRLELDNGGTMLEVGKSTEYEKETNSVGTVKRIKIGHDNNSKYAAWHLEKVEIKEESSGDVFCFAANRWISDEHEDKKTEIEIWADGVTPDDDSEKEKQKWKLEVFTSDKPSAGTSANVYVILEGDRGVSRKLALDNHGGDFERGKCSVVEVASEEIGEVMKLKVGHDGKGSGNGWHLDKVAVTGVDPVFTRQVFPCNAWLDDSKDDKKVERELSPEDDPKNKNKSKGKGKNEKDKPKAADSKDEKKEESKVYWHVEIQTSLDEAGSGTDADVYIYLIGSAGTSRKIELPKEGKYFEMGSKDTFDITTKDIGSLEKIRIGHNNSGFGPGWHLDKVIVISRETDASLVFPCNRWLCDDEGDKRIEVEINTDGVLPASG